MTASGVETELIHLLSVFLIAGAVGVVVTKFVRIPYTIALLIAGFVASIAGVSVGIELTHDIILLVLLPPLLFEGAATTDLASFRENFPVIATLAIAGLVLSILFVGVAVRYVLGFPLLVALLFAAIILPTDPVSVLALFEEMGAPERLTVLVEGESLLNDGVGVVIFTALLSFVMSDVDPAALATPARLGRLLGDIAVASVGGAVVGGLAGYAVYRVMVGLDEHMTEIVLTVILVYGSFLLAEHYLGVSGVIATVVAGLFIGNRGREYAMSAQTKVSVFNTWATAAFIVNTFIFIVIGTQTPLVQIARHANLLVPALLIVLVGRAVVVYPLTELVNRTVLTQPVSREYQHVIVWSGLHASIPIALVLGLPPGTPLREEMRVMVFGIAGFGLVVQGLTIGRLVEHLGIATTSDEERLYQLLIGRARAVDAVLEEARALHEDNRIPDEVYEKFAVEYRSEKEQLDATIAELLDEHPEIRDRERTVAERHLLKHERSAVKTAELDGLLSSDVAAELMEEVNLKLDRLDRGESTVVASRSEEGYDEFWRAEARDHDVLADESRGPS
ncbi:Na+/H+ antiporter [Halostella litorea]|uniref:Na+/H+ antiporter n=1 Tax=Halostella litorea TaxID=2528831 RepID=UPI0010925BF8|nr:Na+/H+ antiporter [Halostella litorea]